MSAALSLLAPAVAPAPPGGIWLPPQASSQAGSTDALVTFLAGLSVFVLALVVGTTLLYLFKYRHKQQSSTDRSHAENTRRPIAWVTAPTLVLVGVVFLWGFRGYLDLSVPPAEAIAVSVRASQKGWSFDYPKLGISEAKELITPTGRPVKLTMVSTDVPHSLYIPAFRLSKDVLVDRYTVSWFEATEEGSYDLLCADFCGADHSMLITKVKVLGGSAFEQWVQSGGGTPDGSKLFVAKGCSTCHSITTDRKGLQGPPMAGKYDSMETLANGTEIKVDDAYIRESILKPNAKVVRGYKPVMPAFEGQLGDKPIKALTEYIKSLKGS